MAYLPAAFAGGKEDHIALLQVMDRYLFAYFTLLSRSPGQVDACTLERKIDQGGAIHPRARSAPITVGRTSKGFGRFHYLVDPLTPDFSGGRTRGKLDDDKKEKKIKKRPMIQFAHSNTHTIT